MAAGSVDLPPAISRSSAGRAALAPLADQLVTQTAANHPPMVSRATNRWQRQSCMPTSRRCQNIQNAATDPPRLRTVRISRRENSGHRERAAMLICFNPGGCLKVDNRTRSAAKMLEPAEGRSCSSRDKLSTLETPGQLCFSNSASASISTLIKCNLALAQRRRDRLATDGRGFCVDRLGVQYSELQRRQHRQQSTSPQRCLKCLMKPRHRLNNWLSFCTRAGMVRGYGPF